MKVKELIELIDNSEETLYCLDDVEDTVDEKTKKVTTINVDNHRHYSIATDIYQCEDGFVGVTGLYEMFNDCSVPSDFDINCEASEYEAVQKVTYRPKKCHS